MEVVHVVGGPLDGTIGEIAPKCSELGFFIDEEPNTEEPDNPWWRGYYDSGRKDRDGLRIFEPR